MGTDAVLAMGGALDLVFPADDPDLRKAEKIIGYTALAVSVPSLLYGAFVLARCEQVAPAAEKHIASAANATAPGHTTFPDSVLGFKFASDASQTQTTCIADSGRSWRDGAEGALCHWRDTSGGRPDVRVEFRRGQVSQLTVVYPVASEQLHARFDQALEELAKDYGRPQRGPAPWRPECGDQAIAECLQKGEKPGRSLWNWPSGYIELLPVIVSGELFVEARYVRYEAD